MTTAASQSMSFFIQILKKRRKEKRVSTETNVGLIEFILHRRRKGFTRDFHCSRHSPNKRFVWAFPTLPAAQRIL